ncbi:pheromone A receptor-domain-containing protein [Mycena leptocephala]|nr:pheromone A receptor-domain-containing protein [Mycena leptocephala]
MRRMRGRVRMWVQGKDTSHKNDRSNRINGKRKGAERRKVQNECGGGVPRRATSFARAALARSVGFEGASVLAIAVCNAYSHIPTSPSLSIRVQHWRRKPRTREGSKHARLDPNPYSSSSPPPTRARARPHLKSFRAAMHEGGERLSGEKGCPNLEIDIPCAYRDIHCARVPAGEDSEDGVEGEGGRWGEYTSRPVSAPPSHAHAGAASTSPPPTRAQSDVGTMRECAVSISISTSFSTSIPVDHLRATPRLHPHPHPQLQLFRDARKMDNLWSCSARRRCWALQLSASGARRTLEVVTGRGCKLWYSKRLGGAREDVHRLHQNVKRRQFYQIAPVRTVTKTRAEKRCAILIDLAIGLGIPPLQIPLLRIHRPRPPLQHLRAHRLPRRDLREAPAIVLFHLLPPILIGAVSAVYCVRIKSFYNSRSQFRLRLSASTHANLNLDRYLRLMMLASTGLLLTVPLATFVLYSNVAVTGLSLWVSWADTHRNFSRVVQRIERRDAETKLSKTTVGFPVCGEAYGRQHGGLGGGGWGRLAQRPNTTSPPLMAPRAAHPNPPVFIRKETTQMQESFNSFNMSASYGGVSLLEYDAEKTRMLGAGEYDGGEKLTLGDVSGMLPDHKESDYFSSPSVLSASPDTESVHSTGEEIEVSSLHRASVHIPTAPESAHVRRSSVLDSPMPVVDADDIV